MKRSSRGLGPLFCSLLWGCSAALVPYTRNPHKKLANAEWLVESQDRPLPAERLIREAMATFQEKNDEVGLADCYRAYARFLGSPSVVRWEWYYRKHGFEDRRLTFDSRVARSLEYLDKARELYRQNRVFDRLSNIEYHFAYYYENNGRIHDACGAYDQALEDYRLNIEDNPGAKPRASPGYSSFPDFILAKKKQVGCPP